MVKTAFKPLLALAGLCLLLAGCTKVGPDYVKPDLAAPASWQRPGEAGPAGAQLTPQALATWWTSLGDPLLDSYIKQAVADNLDLHQAWSRLSEARARRDISGAALSPTLDAGGSATKSRSGGSESNHFSLGFDSGWELDLFGGERRSLEASQAQLEASREDLRDVLVSLLSEVALNYIDVRTYQARLAIARENLTTQRQILSLTRDRYRSGLTSELAVQQARYAVSSIVAQIPTLQTGLVEAMNQLAVLLGKHPGSLDSQLGEQGAIPVVPESIAIGIPADTLRHRPDVRRTERQLAAQTAEIGVATADLYPVFKLSGSIGLESLTTGKLFQADSRTFSFGPSFSWPIFDAGAIRANIRLQSSLQLEALAKYRATVLDALAEVKNSLTASSRERERNQALQESVDAAKQASSLADIQYRAGMITFSDFLDTRRSLLSFEDQLAQSTGTMAADLVRLYKALGGGWSTIVPESSTTTTGKKELTDNG